MRVFVTGGNGFIGSVVVRKLIEQGHTVRCLLRSHSKTDRIDQHAFEKQLGDVRDKDSLLLGMKDCDAVIHLASLSNWNDIHSPLMHDVVVKGSSKVLEAAQQSGNLKTVFVSTVATIGGTNEPVICDESNTCNLDLSKLPYSKAKITAEKLCAKAHQNGLPVVIVNPAEVYGPNDTALNTACNLIDFAKNSPVLTCHGGTSIVHVDDVATGIAAAMNKGRSGERYILGGDNLTVRELAELTLHLLDQKKRIVQLPNWILQTSGKIASTLRLPFPVNPAVIPYATRFWLVDSTKAKEELGVAFRDAENTLRPTLQWLRQENHIS